MSIRWSLLFLSLISLVLPSWTLAQVDDAAEDPPVRSSQAEEWEQLLRDLSADSAEAVQAPPGAPPTTSSEPWTASEMEALSEALADYAETGEAPILGMPTHRAVPFGHEVPVVRCLPLRACDLAFEVGEKLAGWALGDTERWLTEELTEGVGPTAQAHLLLKPTDYDLATNLVVVTNRRTYHLELESPEYESVHDEDSSASIAYDAQLRWWYPDQFVHRAHLAKATAQQEVLEQAEARKNAISIDQPLDPKKLSFAYEVKKPWRPSRRLPWEPVTILDDGRNVYLLLPTKADRFELPAVLGLLDDGSHYPLNTRLEGRWIVVPSLFERAELILGTGKHRKRLTVIASDRKTR